MKVIWSKRYQCELCGTIYEDYDLARKCETRPIVLESEQQVKLGDVVRVTYGEGAGQLARVRETYIAGLNFGQTAWERYWHTPVLMVDSLNGTFWRAVTFDAFERVDQLAAQETKGTEA